MGPPSQGRNPISLRCSRHFSVYYMNPYSAESLEIIYGEILDWFFKDMVVQCLASLKI